MRLFLIAKRSKAPLAPHGGVSAIEITPIKMSLLSLKFLKYVNNLK